MASDFSLELEVLPCFAELDEELPFELDETFSCCLELEEFTSVCLLELEFCFDSLELEEFDS